MIDAKKHFFTAAVTTALVSIASVAPAEATFKFGSSGIMFGKDTTVKFGFHESGGLFRSDLGVYELDADGNPIKETGVNLFSELTAHDKGNGNKWDPDGFASMRYPKGTCGITVLGCEVEFEFQADKQYALGLYSYHRTGGNLMTVSYSNNQGMAEGGAETDGQLFLFGSLGSETDAIKFPNPEDYIEGSSILKNGGILDIGIDDSGNNVDADYNDFQITATITTDVPEPTVLLGLGVVASGMLLTRRKKGKAS